MAELKKEERARVDATRGAETAPTLAEKLPIPLYIPNLIGYVRVWAFLVAVRETDPGSPTATWALVLSLALDYIDGPCARALGMCTQFGDLLDHYTDHITMFWLVYITSASQVNIVVNALHMLVAFGYMAVTGHYFKHSAGGNVVTRTVEANNYFNMPSMLWNANTMLIPLLKLSYHNELGLARTGSTALVDLCDALGLLVNLAYSIAVCIPPDIRMRLATRRTGPAEHRAED